jgi:plasmid segregation protein ParM
MKIGIDVGYGRVKGISNTKKVDFPSVIGDFYPVKFITGMESDLTSKLAVEYNYKRKFVGESALKQSIPQSTVDKERTVQEEGLTLLVSALALLTDEKFSDTINLVVGLPVMHYDGLRTKYLTSIKTLHTIRLLSLSGESICKKHLPVQDAKVLPQPFGTLFDRLLNERGEVVNPQLASSKVGIIDIGYNTVDLARSDSLEYINPRSTSFSGLGMFNVFQVLTNEIYKNLGLEIPLEKIEPHFRSGEIKVAGRAVSIEQYKRTALKEAASQIISKVKSIWPDRWELDQIIITGGGAILLGEFLASEFGQQSYISPNSSFANVNGYLKFAQRIWK